MADKSRYDVGLARAVLGQGLGMGWGDEAEAWVRSKLGDQGYEDALQQIRSEYGQFARENPISQVAGEFGGGAIPGVVAMAVPGGQAAGAQQLSRSTLNTLARLGAIGAGTGAVSGAGSATEGSRLPGAALGAVIGGTTGAAAPLVAKGAGAGMRWLRERLAPSESYVGDVATRKLAEAVRSAGMTPRQLEQRMGADRVLGVPSKVANVSPATADLARAVAQRTGRGGVRMEEELLKQKSGARERVYEQVKRGLRPGDYYADEERLVADLRNKASTLYDDAYAKGTVDDPRLNEVLKDPTFAGFFKRAKAIADKEALAAKLRGEDPSRFQLREIYEPQYVNDPQTGLPILQGFNLREAPDVRTLDYIKRGIDATIDSGFRGEGMSKAEANALRQLRKQFVTAIDENVPEYAAARQTYAGDIEVIDAMRAGFDTFKKLNPEEVSKLVAGMSQAERDAYRTGVARHLYSTVMDPRTNSNSARLIIESPSAQRKLEPLFDTPAQFRLFKSALQREKQLFDETGRILSGSQTAKTQQAQQALEGQTGVGEAIAGAITGNFSNSLMNSALRGFNKVRMTDDVADKLSTMLLSSDPAEVGSVVRLLEDYSVKAAPKALAATAAQAGAATGLTGSVFPVPYSGVDAPSVQESIDSEMQPPPGISLGPSLEEALQAEQQQP